MASQDGRDGRLAVRLAGSVGADVCTEKMSRRYVGHLRNQRLALKKGRLAQAGNSLASRSPGPLLPLLIHISIPSTSALGSTPGEHVCQLRPIRACELTLNLHLSLLRPLRGSEANAVCRRGFRGRCTRMAVSSSPLALHHSLLRRASTCQRERFRPGSDLVARGCSA